MTTQNDIILSSLREHIGSWVAMPILASAAGCYAVHSRISDLRKRGFTIHSRIENREGKRHSYYRLEDRPQ